MTASARPARASGIIISRTVPSTTSAERAWLDHFIDGWLARRLVLAQAVEGSRLCARARRFAQALASSLDMLSSFLTSARERVPARHRESVMAYEHILYEVSDKVATITLNRSDRMNAWTPTMERDVRHAMEASSADDNVRVIVLTGAGRAFCAGADMDALKGLDPNDVRRASNLPPFDMNRRPDWQTRYGFYPSIGKPVIAMLNGATAGIGLVHALYCDLRFAADNTVFTTAFARRGLIAEHGMSWMLPRIVGHANAMDLLLSARRVVE